MDLQRSQSAPGGLNMRQNPLAFQLKYAVFSPVRQTSPQFWPGKRCWLGVLSALAHTTVSVGWELRVEQEGGIGRTLFSCCVQGPCRFLAQCVEALARTLSHGCSFVGCAPFKCVLKHAQPGGGRQLGTALRPLLRHVGPLPGQGGALWVRHHGQVAPVR